MAVEINFQAFMFGPWSAPPINVVNTLSKRYPLLDGDDDDFEIAPPGTTACPSSAEPVALDDEDFVYSPLHDLESLWWLGGYFVFDYARRLRSQASQRDAKGKALRRRFPEPLFEDQFVRCDVMRTTGYFAQWASILPQSLRPAAAALEKLRRELMSAYEETEKTEEAPSKPAFKGLHSSFAATMKSLADILAEVQKAEQDLPPVPPRKRSTAGSVVSSKDTTTGMKRPRVVA